MAYKRQTREVYFRGRQVLDPSKQMFAEVREQKTEDASFIRDMEQTGRDYKAALDQWNKNQELLDKEKIAFWEKVSPTMVKLAGETLQQGMDLKRRADADFERKKWGETPAADRVKLKKEAQDFHENHHDINNKRETIAQQAAAAGFHSYAEYIKGLNRNSLTSLHMRLLSQGMIGFADRLQSALQDDETQFDGPNGTTFTGVDAARDRELLEILIEQLEKDFVDTAVKAGVPPRLIYSTLGDEIETVRRTVTQKYKSIIRRDELERDVSELGSKYLQAIASYDSQDPDKSDVFGFEKLNSTFLESLRNANAGQEGGNNKAKQDYQKVLIKYLRDMTRNDLGDDVALLNLEQIIMNPTNNPNFLVPHYGKLDSNGRPKMVSLNDLDRIIFDIPTIQEAALKDLDRNAINQKKWNENAVTAGWIPRPGVPDEEKKLTIKEEWLTRIRKGNITDIQAWNEEVLDYYYKALSYGVGPEYLAEIRGFLDGRGEIMSAQDTRTIIRDKVNKDGPRIPANSNVLKFGNQDVINEELEKGTFIEVDLPTEKSNELQEAELTTSETIRSTVSINGVITPRTLAIINELEQKVETEVNRYLFQQPKGTPAFEASREVDPKYPTDDITTLYKSVTADVINEFNTIQADQTNQVNHRWFRGENGDFNNILDLKKFNWGRSTKELRKLRNQVINESIDRISPNLPKSEIYTTNLFYNKDELESMLIKAGKINSHLPTEFASTWGTRGFNPYDALKGQIDLWNKQNPNNRLEGEVVVPESVQTLFNSGLKPNDFKEIFRILKDNNGFISSTTPNLEGSRLINKKVNKLLRANGIQPRPEAGHIRTVLKALGTGDGIGIYNLREEDVQRIIQNTPYLRERFTNMVDFREDTKLQEGVMKELIQQTIDFVVAEDIPAATERHTEAAEAMRRGGQFNIQQAEIRRNEAIILRRVLNYLATGSYDIDPDDPVAVYNSTQRLILYRNSLSGTQTLDQYEQRKEEEDLRKEQLLNIQLKYLK